MATQVVNAQPGQTITILVRAVQNTSNGVVYSDYASLQYLVPDTNVTGGNIGSSNTSTDVQLGGGSLYAGTFNANVGLINLANTTPIGKGVILNQYGLAAFNNGTKEFFLNALDGTATFAGTISTTYTDVNGTHVLQIGQNAGNSGKAGIYINDQNYWYADGTWSATASNIQGALVSTNILTPGPISNLKNTWKDSSLAQTSNLTVTWDFDTSGIQSTGVGAYSNQNTKDFLLSFILTDGTTKTISVPANKSPTISQKYVLTTALNQGLFGLSQTTNLASISVRAEDTFGNLGPASTLVVESYVSPLVALAAAVTPTVVGVNNGYTVSITPSAAAKTLFSDPSFAAMEIAESISSATSWNSTQFATISVGTVNPATILTSNLNARWVAVRYVDILGGSTSWSTVSNPQPVSPVTINVSAPNEVASDVVAFKALGSTANAGDDIGVAVTVYSVNISSATGTGGPTGTMTYVTSTAHGFKTGDQVAVTGVSPDTNFNTIQTVTYIDATTFSMTGSGSTSSTGGIVQYSGVTYIAKLVSTVSTSKVGYFYFTPDGTYGTGHLVQNFTITKSDLFNQLGGYYSSFNGLLISVNPSGIRSTGKSIATFSRTSTLSSGAAPILSTYAVADGYTATYDFSTTNATHGEIYQKHSSWGTITTPIDYLNGTWVSNTVSPSASNQLVLTNVTDNALNSITTFGDVDGAFPTGYQIFGANVAPNTYIVSGSYTAPNFTLVLNKSLLGTGSGTYKANALVYSGQSPANITNSLYDQFYVILRLYDDFGNASPISGVSQVTPTNAGSISSFTNAVNIGGAAGAVYVGTDLASVGERVVIASKDNTTTNSITGFSGISGIYAFDNSNTVTTAIIANATAGAYTFKTTKALIADWYIDSTKIQNTLGVASNYVGMSATGIYSFWAGSTTSGGDSNAKFAVTPTGYVQAKNISIIGSGTVSISSAVGSGAGNLITYTAAGHGLSPGQLISINSTTGGPTFNLQNVQVYTTPTLNTFTVQSIANGTASGGTAYPILISAGGVFTVNGAGIMSATGANITGTINAQFGQISGNLSLGGSLYSGTIKTSTITSVAPNASTGAVYTGTNSFIAGDVVAISGISPAIYSGIWTVTAANSTTFTIGSNTSTTAITVGTGQAISTSVQSFIMNNAGLIFNSPTTQGITTIDATTGYLSTQSANIGGWLVNPSTNLGSLYKTTTAGTIKLDSVNARVSVQSTANPTYTAGINTPSATSDVVFWAGNGGVSTSNNFYVTADGTLHATGAVFGDYATTTALNTTNGNVTTANTNASNAVTTANAAKAKADTSLQAGGYAVANASNQITSINTNGITIKSGNSFTLNTDTTANFQLSALVLNSSGIAAYNASTYTFYIDNSGNAYFGGTLVAASGSFSGAITATSGKIGGFTINSNDYLSYGTTNLWGGSTLNTYALTDSSRGIYVHGLFSDFGMTVTGDVAIITPPTDLRGSTTASGNRTGTTSAANGYFNSSSGYFTYSTASSQRYKNSIVDLNEIPELNASKILNLKPRAFKYNSDYIQDNDQRFDQMIPGFISEEIHEVFPISVDIQDGKIETWNERMLIPGMVSLLQDLYKKIDILQAQLDSLTK